MALRDYIEAIGGGGSVAIVVEWIVGTGDLAVHLLDFLLGNIELLLSITAVTSGRLAPEIAWLPENLLNKLVLALAALYVLVLVSRLIRNWNNDG